MLVAHDDPKVNIENIIPYSKPDDGEVKIPIILLGNFDSGLIFKYKEENDEDIIVSISIEETGAQTKIVRAEFWLNSIYPDSYTIFSKMEEVLNNFGDKVEFTPKYKFKNLVNKGHPKSFIQEHCYSNGRFCQVENEEIEPMTAIEEALRQICLWKETNGVSVTNAATKALFWRYISSYTQCLKGFEFSHKGKLNCSERSFEMGDVPQEIINKVEQCKGEPSPDSQSAKMLLTENENEYIYSDIYLVPAFFVNDIMVKEKLNESTIITAICDNLEDKPAYCDTFYMGNSKNQTSAIKDNMFGLLFLAIAGIVTILTVLLVIFRSKINTGVNREIYNEVNQYVSDYMKMEE